MKPNTQNLMLITLAAGALQWGAFACSNTSSQDVRSQPHPRSQRPVRASKPSRPTMAQPSSTPLKQGTPEYNKKLEELTNLRPGTDPRSGTRKLRTGCGAPNGKNNCRDCVQAIRRLGARPPAAKPRHRATAMATGMATGMDPR